MCDFCFTQCLSACLSCCVKVNRLRQDLKWAKDQLQLLTSRLSTNVSVRSLYRHHHYLTGGSRRWSYMGRGTLLLFHSPFPPPLLLFPAFLFPLAFSHFPIDFQLLLSVSFSSLLFCSFPHFPFSSCPLPLRRSLSPGCGERCKLSGGVRGGTLAANAFLMILTNDVNKTKFLRPWPK